MPPTHRTTDDSTSAAVEDMHDSLCTCTVCIQQIVRQTPETPLRHALSKSIDRVGLQSKASFTRSDVSDPESSLRSSSPPSIGSVGSKRSRLFSDCEDSDSDSDYSHKRSKQQPFSSEKRPRIYLPQSHDTFFNFCKQPETAFVDKTSCFLSLPDRFRYVLLRPPRFGKSSLLSMLVEYYDIHGAQQFARSFGSLAVSKATEHPPRHSQHLCLSLSLDGLSVYSTPEEFADSLAANLYFSLDQFLATYASELHPSSTDHPVLKMNEDMFGLVFELARSQGHTLLVTVDDLDVPFRKWSRDNETSASPLEFTALLNSRFWDPLLAGSDIIHKLFVAGTFLPEPSLLQQLQLTTPPNPELFCGFSEEEANQLAISVMGGPVDMAELQREWGGYSYSQEVDAASPSLLHPQGVIDWIRRRADPSENYSGSYRVLSNILEFLPEESDDPDVVTTHKLVELLATGVAKLDSKMAALVKCDPAAPTWAALYHAGALTPDPQRPGTYRVPNEVALSLIHSRVDKIFADRYRLQWSYYDAWSAYCTKRPDPQLLLSLLSRVLRDQAQRCLASGSQNEPILHGIFELVMRNEHTGGQKPGETILLSLDSGLVQVRGYSPPKKLVTLDLRTVTLLGVWRGHHPNEDGRTPTTQELQELHDELRDLDDSAISKQPYRVWSPTLEAMETVSVGSFLEPEPQHTQFLAVGGDRVLVSLPLCVPAEDESEDEAEDNDEDIDTSDDWCFDDVVEDLEEFVAENVNPLEERRQTYPDEYY